MTLASKFFPTFSPSICPLFVSLSRSSAVTVTAVSTVAVAPSIEIIDNGFCNQKRLQRDSCPELRRPSLKLSETGRQMTDAAVKHSSSELLSLRALSLIERAGNNDNREVKFAGSYASEKSTSSSSSASISYKQSDFLSPVSADGQQTVQISYGSKKFLTFDSDDTSYAKAIKSSSTTSKRNGSTSCEEDDTDRSGRFEQSHAEGWYSLETSSRFEMRDCERYS